MSSPSVPLEQSHLPYQERPLQHGRGPSVAVRVSGCLRYLPLTQHYWTGWINDFDGGMGQNCPFNSVVTGFKSEHSNHHEDRRWKMKCSKKIGMVRHSCYTTGYVNWFDHAMDFEVPASYYVVGMHGYHHNGYEDRRYRFTLCRVSL
ncbi:hypothetical protein Bbelb_094550 [Branchiostoma belcheri]|nr:hypothetical protein Bbelb_094550 [Branchiostoma belcheri]